MRDDLASAIEKHRSAFAISLNNAQIGRLADYYEFVQDHNPLLHLVAPCSAEEFATKHVLESLTLTKHFAASATVVDIGSGAGLPIIPCLVARADISATLIESSQKKSVFLREALKTIGALKRATILCKPFESLPSPKADYVTCRALDDFLQALPSLIHWAPSGATLLLFGGQSLSQRLEELNFETNVTLLPNSDRRFLLEVKKL